MLYWKNIVREAGLDYTKIGELTENRKEWRAVVKERMKHIEEWERKGAKSFQDVERGSRNFVAVLDENFTCDHCQKLCRSKGGLIAHIRSMHEVSKEKRKFNCEKCGLLVTKDANLVNHVKICGGMQASRPGQKRCHFCFKEVSAKNFARHVKNCSSNPRDDSNDDTAARVHRKKEVRCDDCGTSIQATNLARHKNGSCPMRRVVP